MGHLAIGSLLSDSLDADGGVAELLPNKINRHTFWCGQSGSGKTYALGVFLEQVLLHTHLPIVILDPNADFVKFGEMRNDAPADVAEELATRDVRIFRPYGTGAPLKARFVDMPLRSRAAILGIDPIQDAEEYNVLIHLEDQIQDHAKEELVQFLRDTGEDANVRLAQRVENLGVDTWDLWSWGDYSVMSELDEKPDVAVADLSGYPTQPEARAAALAVLDHLWETRERRLGRLIVIDEAHNLCSPEPTTHVERLLTERIVQIAAEGRKYGLWLVLSTQRPSKVHPGALSQCDNLALMRMSSPRDLDELGEIFGFAPDEMMEKSPAFAQGQALFAGGFIPEASFVQMGDRVTEEGGIDVSVPLR